MTRPTRGRRKIERLALATLGVAALVGVGAVTPPNPRAQDLDLTKIFWCDPAKPGGQSPAECAGSRDLIMQNCTACHTFVPIVKAQKSPDEWAATIGVHRERLPDVADAQINQIQQYLVSHFNPSNPPPELPPELEALGTNQAN